MRRKRTDQQDPLVERLGILIGVRPDVEAELSRLMHEAANAAGYQVCRKRGRCTRTGVANAHRGEAGFHETTVVVPRCGVFQLGCIASVPRRRFALRRHVEGGRAALRRRQRRVLLDFELDRGRIRFTGVRWGDHFETVDPGPYL